LKTFNPSTASALSMFYD